MPRKEGKEKKKLGTLNLLLGSQSPEERECRRESEPLVPTDTFAPGHQVLSPLTNRNIVYKKRFVKTFVKKNFCVVNIFFFVTIFLGNATACNAR